MYGSGRDYKDDSWGAAAPVVDGTIRGDSRVVAAPEVLPPGVGCVRGGAAEAGGAAPGLMFMQGGLCKINEDQKVALDLDPYVKKLLNARRRVVLVNNILQNAQERLRRLNHSVAKETARRRAMLDSAAHHSQTSPNK
ncbi:hypothetical protein GDO78_022232 [Eleutherodactylus coqui]|uniref:Biogenesis of lysosome-related organelles complex 1 subunit 7 n=1 Tax=Eleutherodactylus coqui TaxID=57060 RepID=A0A8J6B8B7_ELECQ|nr:hypothetical protein GDO78_022232 [Eleutherodactylus coqui]